LGKTGPTLHPHGVEEDRRPYRLQQPGMPNEDRRERRTRDGADSPANWRNENASMET
jgi:hypothetical protein